MVKWFGSGGHQLVWRDLGTVLNTSARTDGFPADIYTETHKVTPVMAQGFNIKANIRPREILKRNC
jgi:hypothetical protein